jgi:hypothetical protein
MLLRIMGQTSWARTIGTDLSKVPVQDFDFLQLGEYLNCGHLLADLVIPFNSDSVSTIASSNGR